MKSVKLGMIGFGTVGAGVVEILSKRGDMLAARLGAPIEIAGIAVRSKRKRRPVGVDRAVLTTDPGAIVESPDVDIVVEVMGGEDPALDLTLRAAKNGKSIVTANKLLLATHGRKVYKAAEDAGVELGFEAAVAGAVPVVRSIRHALAGDQVELIQGIVNGTGNYILSRMTDEGRPFDEVLSDAQRLGYAEADPTFDVEGVDSAHKIAILAALGFQAPVTVKDVYTEGITAITPEDIEMAREFGYRVKLLAIAKKNGESVDVRVHPAMLPSGHMMANVNGAFNAVEIVASAAGTNMLVGPGAGSGPTASAVMGDVMDIARKLVHGGAGKACPMMTPLGAMKKVAVKPMDDVVSEYYLRFTVPDRPGVLARLAGALGANKISISSMIQRGRKENAPVSVVLMTHTAREADLKKALGQIGRMGLCTAPTMKIRIVENGKN